MTQISRQGTALIQFGKEEEGKDSGSVAQKPQSLIKRCPWNLQKLHFEYMDTN
jgi:hypothetical protein